MNMQMSCLSCVADYFFSSLSCFPSNHETVLLLLHTKRTAFDKKQKNISSRGKNRTDFLDDAADGLPRAPKANTWPPHLISQRQNRLQMPPAVCFGSLIDTIHRLLPCSIPTGPTSNIQFQKLSATSTDSFFKTRKCSINVILFYFYRNQK